MTSRNLLVELLVQELPPKALQKLGEAFAAVLGEQLLALGLASTASLVTPYASPRRLAAHVSAVAERAPDRAVQQKLMPVAVGLDAAGQPSPALLKKLQALGADICDPAAAVAALRRAQDGKGQALFYDRIVPGATLAAGLQQALDGAIAKLPIPKVMSYQLETDCALPGWSSVNFVRPAQGLVGLHGSTVGPVKALGLTAGNCTQGHRFEAVGAAGALEGRRVVRVKGLGLTAGNCTQGHRFEAVVSPVLLSDADGYAATLRSDGAVIASFAERRAEIAHQLAAAAASLGRAVRVIEDQALLDEVTGLVERPRVLVCEFESRFLDIPQECLILTMKAHQKYFPLLDAAGRLTHQLLVGSNISPEDPPLGIDGNQRVVRPRPADAQFFFDQDRRKPLAARVDALCKVVYHHQLGTQAERVQRVRAIAALIARTMAETTAGPWADAALAQQADQAALLAKAD